MSAVKIFAIGVMVSGSLASSTLAGSIQDGDPSPTQTDGRISTARGHVATGRSAWRTSHGDVAAENLAGSTGGGNSGSGYGASGGGSSDGSLVLGTTNSAIISPPIDFSGSSFRIANNYATPAQAPAPTVLPSPAPAQSSQQAASPAAPEADAFINFGNGPFADAGRLTTGGARSIFSSPVFNQFFPNGATSQQVANFENRVLQTVSDDYDRAGHPVSLTTDPDAPAAHTLSVVAGTSNPDNPGAIGITGVGRNGFSFVDVLDKYKDAKDADALATAVGNNVAHELMHAFGIKDHPEASGAYVDAASTTFASLADPDTAFSPVAKDLLSTLDFRAVGAAVSSKGVSLDGAQVIAPGDPAAVPEPATLALWGLAGGVALAAHRRRARASA